MTQFFATPNLRSSRLIGCLLSFMFFAIVLPYAQADNSVDSVESLAKKITAVMDAYHDVQLSGSEVTVREMNPSSDKKGESFSIPGKFDFRQQGVLWNVDRETFVTRYGTKELVAKNYSAGFDGETHFNLEKEKVTYGEETTSGLLYQPRQLFFRTGWSHRTLTNSFTRDGSKLTGKKTIRGHECVMYQVTIRTSGQFNRLEIAFAPDLGWLPIESKRTNRGKLYSTDTLSDFQKTPEGLWYAKKIVSTYETLPIPYRKRETHIKTFASSKSLQKSDFEHQLADGATVVDYGRGIVYINDPWWDDLAPWLRENHNWPVTSHSELWDLSSFASDAIDGLPAPGIQASEWINGDPGDWDRKDRKVTILYFYGGRSIQPHPKWLNALRKLWRANKANGVEMICVATPTTPDLTKQSAKELQIEFPIAIDKQGANNNGATHAAFGLKSYAGVVVVDKVGVAHIIKPRQNSGAKDLVSNVEVAVASALAAADSKMTLLGAVAGRMDLKMMNSIKREWRSRAQKAKARSSVSGKVTDPKGKAVANAVVKLEPRLRMISGSNPNGRTTISDRNRLRTSRTDKDGKYEFADLPKGTYQVSIQTEGLRKSTADVILATREGSKPATLDQQLEPKTAAEIAAENRVTVQGVVVDAETDEPILNFVIQGGRVDNKDPKKVTWGYTLRKSTAARQGRFNTTIDWKSGWRSRIVADGYEPMPVLSKAPKKGQRLIELRLALKKGRSASGRVVDHNGKPVNNAAIFTAGKRGISVTKKQAVNSWDGGVDSSHKKWTTNEKGEFELSVGESRTLVISTDELDVHVFPLKEKLTDLEIRLPAPGKLVIDYDIAGADSPSMMFMQRLHDGDKTWQGVDVMRNFKIENGKQLVLKNAVPGKYQIARQRLLVVDGRGHHPFMDRQQIEVLSGKSTNIAFVRNAGTSIEGTVTKIKEKGIKGAFVRVKNLKPVDELDKRFNSTKTLDAQICLVDGKFKTSLLSPGKYQIEVTAYAPMDPNAGFRSGIEQPKFVTKQEVTIPETGPPVVVEMELKVRK
jgi:hypothetical protein